MKIIKFEYFTNNTIENNEIFYDSCAEIKAWSRIYEYPHVYNFIKDRFNPDQKIHNTCWGLDICNCHVRFKQLLEKKFGIENVVNSDIKKSNLKNTCLYDVTTKNNYFKEKFDYVVNISAIEEIRFDHLKIIKNLYEQVKKEGYLILTFDLPGLQIESVEKFLNTKISEVKTKLNGSNSMITYTKYTHLNCGILIIQK